MTNARDTMLAAIRSGLRGAAPEPLPPLEPEPMATITIETRLERFTAVLTRVGGRVERVADLAAAAQRVRGLLAEAGVRRVAISDAAEVAEVRAALPADIQVLDPDAPRAELLDADAGITCAQWGIAETGTLVLLSANEQNRVASLLPALHIALLPVDRLLGTLAETFAKLQLPGGSVASRTITFVTGPSRTADIELTLVVGVHGPKALHVLLVGGL